MNERHNSARGSNEWADTYGSLGNGAAAQQTQLPLHILDNWLSADGQRQPFKPYSAEKLEALAQSIRENGVIEPICVRPMPSGRYQIIAGHNRVAAAKLAGLPTVPALIRHLDDDQAAVLMIDSNLQHRETLLPSEKAFAYLEKMDALNRQGQRVDLTCGPLGHKLGGEKSRDIIAGVSEDSARQIQRYLRLVKLLPQLLDIVDSGKLSVRAGVELSYLEGNEQRLLIQVMNEAQCKAPSMTQAKALREASKAGQLSQETILAILAGKAKAATISLPAERINGFFPPNTSLDEMEQEIYLALEAYRKK